MFYILLGCIDETVNAVNLLLVSNSCLAHVFHCCISPQNLIWLDQTLLKELFRAFLRPMYSWPLAHSVKTQLRVMKMKSIAFLQKCFSSLNSRLCKSSVLKLTLWDSGGFSTLAHFWSPGPYIRWPGRKLDTEQCRMKRAVPECTTFGFSTKASAWIASV